MSVMCNKYSKSGGVKFLHRYFCEEGDSIGKAESQK